VDFNLDNLPNILKELGKFQKELSEVDMPNLWQQLDKCQEAMQETHASLDNPKQKQMLGDMLSELAKARKECEGAIPDIEQEFKRQMQDLDRIKDLTAELDQAEKALDEQVRIEAEQLAAMNVPLAEKDVSIDASHGAGLAAELLQALGMLEALKAKPKEKFEDAGSIARHWDHSEEADADAHATPPAPPAPPQPPITPAPATQGSGIFKTVRKKSIPP
jgi:septal ring factor EnvC (AmiA/AmiB activator)